MLTYHRVAPPDGSPRFDPGMTSATPETFAAQMRWLAGHYRVVGVEEVLRAIRGGGALPRRSALVTFDDAYHDFADHAWPVLRALGLPAVLFVPTAFPDEPRRPFWWDRLHHAVAMSSAAALALPGLPSLPLGGARERAAALRVLERRVKSLPHAEAMALVEQISARHPEEDGTDGPRTLSWEELRRLSGEGVALGAHTRNHPLLTRIAPADMEREIREAQADLRREIGATLPIFCYPGGGHDDTVVALLRRAGFEMACTTRDGHNDLATCDPLRLSRTNITRRTTLPVLRLRLERWFAWIDRLRHR